MPASSFPFATTMTRGWDLWAARPGRSGRAGRAGPASTAPGRSGSAGAETGRCPPPPRTGKRRCLPWRTASTGRQVISSYDAIVARGELEVDPLLRPPAGAFAAVMATGIVSVAAFEEQAQARALSTLSELLAWLAAGAYALLVLLIAADLARGAERLRRDLATPPASFESLTFAAASGVLSVRMLLADRRVVAAVLGLVAVAGWLGLGGVAWASLARRPSGRLARAARGSWLLAAVATQSLAVLAALAAQPGSDASPSAVPGGAWASLLLAAALGWWLAGMVLYGLLAVPIWDRLLAALRGAPWAWFDADDWITMGALAITALAGTQIVVAARMVPAARTILGGLGPAAPALAMTAWAAASGWIPPLAP